MKFLIVITAVCIGLVQITHAKTIQDLQSKIKATEVKLQYDFEVILSNINEKASVSTKNAVRFAQSTYTTIIKGPSRCYQWATRITAIRKRVEDVKYYETCQPATATSLAITDIFEGIAKRAKYIATACNNNVTSCQAQIDSLDKIVDKLNDDMEIHLGSLLSFASTCVSYKTTSINMDMNDVGRNWEKCYYKEKVVNELN